jgi:hypothetical protein
VETTRSIVSGGNPDAARCVREGGVVVLAAGIDEVGLEPRLGGNVCGRGFGEELDGARHDEFDHSGDTHAADVP